MELIATEGRQANNYHNISRMLRKCCRKKNKTEKRQRECYGDAILNRMKASWRRTFEDLKEKKDPGGDVMKEIASANALRQEHDKDCQRPARRLAWLQLMARKG